MESERDYSIDWLKALGTLCLFLAHVDAPFWIKEVRGFDVPLMIFASGILATGSLSRAESDREYIIKRVKRLVIPTWIFLVFFYLCMAIAGQLPNILIILKSFLFQRDGGIAGYTWIIWVYIVCAGLTPLLDKIPKNTKTWIIVCIITIAYEFVSEFSDLANIRILYYTVFTVVPYGLFLLFAMNYETFSRLQKIVITVFFIVFHTIFAAVLYIKTGGYVPIGDYKYPARIYYLSYAIPISTCLLCLFRSKYLHKKTCGIVDFISKHSLWIYLWHIFVIAILKYVIRVDSWLVCYLLLVSLSIGITYVQNMLVQSIKKRRDYAFLKYFQG